MVRQSLAERLAATQFRPAGFDYMRAILALGIIWSHSLLLTGDRYTGIGGYSYIIFLMIVPMFFSLSGFLVAGSLERSKTLITFFGLRIFRIMPALTVEVFLSAIILGPLLTTVSHGNYFTSGEFYSYFLNIVGEIHYSLPGVFVTNPVPWVNGQLWTVPWELACYVLLGGLAAFGIFRRRHWLALSLAGLHIIQIGNTMFRTNEEIKVAGGATLVISFVAGLTIYRYRDRIPWSKLLFLAMLVLSVALIRIPNGIRFAAVPLAYVTMYLGLLNPGRNRVILSGDYSYGLYLYGFPVQQAIVAVAPALRLWYWNLLLAVPCAILVAVGSWWLVERPVLGQRGKLKQLEEWYLKRRRLVGALRFIPGTATIGDVRKS